MSDATWESVRGASLAHPHDEARWTRPTLVALLVATALLYLVGLSASGVGRPTGATGLGGLVDASTPAAALVSLLKEKASTYTWVAATIGANSAAGVELATGDPILAIGGVNGTDPTPTVVGAVAAGWGAVSLRARSRAGWRRTSPRRRSAGVTVYDLAAPTS